MSQEHLKSYVKGQCGNPNGRPKGVKNTATVIRDFLKGKLQGTDPYTGKKRKFTAKQIIVLKQIEKAIAGDLKSAEWIVDRIDGKPLQQQSVDMVADNKMIIEIIGGNDEDSRNENSGQNPKGDSGEVENNS